MNVVEATGDSDLPTPKELSLQAKAKGMAVSGTNQKFMDPERSQLHIASSMLRHLMVPMTIISPSPLFLLIVRLEAPPIVPVAVRASATRASKPKMSTEWTSRGLLCVSSATGLSLH